MKLSVIVPVYNEKDSIKEILEKVQCVSPGEGIEKEIVVVDDCSTDGTTEILKNITDKNISVLFHGKNQGKGAAIRTGIGKVGGDFIVIQDADLEYDPSDYPRLLKPILSGEADVVYGSRFSGKSESMSRLHYFGNKLLTVLTNVLYGTALTDMETCYKMVKAPIMKSLKLRANRFDFEPEITSKLLKKKVRIKEIPIAYKGREWSEGKKITWRDGIAALWSLVKYRFTD